MDENKKMAICDIVDREIKKFVDSYETGFVSEADDPEGFDIVFEQYKKSAKYIRDALKRIKTLYFN